MTSCFWWGVGVWSVQVDKRLTLCTRSPCDCVVVWSPPCPLGVWAHARGGWRRTFLVAIQYPATLRCPNTARSTVPTQTLARAFAFVVIAQSCWAFWSTSLMLPWHRGLGELRLPVTRRGEARLTDARQRLICSIVLKLMVQNGFRHSLLQHWRFCRRANTSF